MIKYDLEGAKASPSRHPLVEVELPLSTALQLPCQDNNRSVERVLWVTAKVCNQLQSAATFDIAPRIA